MISIVVQTFRREELLRPLFRAVAAQIATLTVLVELVLIDKSQDASSRSALASAPDFVRYAHEPLTGIARARNRGIAKARDACIILPDHDETPDPDWLATFAGAAARGDLVAFGSIEPEFQEPPANRLRRRRVRVFRDGRRCGTEGHLWRSGSGHPTAFA